MDNSLLAVRDINHKYIVVEYRREKCALCAGAGGLGKSLCVGVGQ